MSLRVRLLLAVGAVALLALVVAGAPMMAREVYPAVLVEGVACGQFVGVVGVGVVAVVMALGVEVPELVAADAVAGASAEASPKPPSASPADTAPTAPTLRKTCRGLRIFAFLLFEPGPIDLTRCSLRR
ncbi:MAG: hypothetical protein ACYC1D_04625 [Acidimicrobiales bacterium]